MQTLNEMLEVAKKQPACNLSVAVAQDMDVLRAVCAARDVGLVCPLFVGDKKQILSIAAEANLVVDVDSVIDVPDKADACTKAAALVRDGVASLLMKGFVDTSVVMKAVLNKENALRTDRQLSHSVLMEVPGVDRLLCVTDSALNVSPSLDQKRSIILNAVSIFHALGYKTPKVAALCAVEKVNPKMPCTLDAAELTRMNREGEITGCIIDGPLALDNAVSPTAMEHKGIVSPLGGKADILMVPDIEAGNMLNKSMEYFSHAKKAGIIMGAKVPVVLTSRASSAESKMYSIALGVLVAAQRDAL